MITTNTYRTAPATTATDELVCQSEGCGKAAHCPLKRLGKGYTAVNIIGVAVSAVIVAASI